MLLERLENRMKEIRQQIDIVEKLFTENEIRHSTGGTPNKKYSRMIVALNNALEESSNEYEASKKPYQYYLKFQNSWASR